jgi:hypothetical protein
LIAGNKLKLFSESEAICGLNAISHATDHIHIELWLWGRGGLSKVRRLLQKGGGGGRPLYIRILETPDAFFRHLQDAGLGL